MSTLKIEIRHKLPLWSRMTSWTATAKAGTKRRWRKHLEDALLAERIVLRCGVDKNYYWNGDPIPRFTHVKITQLIGVNPKTNRNGSKYDKANLIGMTDKLVYDNMTHLKIIKSDGPDVMPDPETAYEYTRKPWHGVRVELEY